MKFHFPQSFCASDKILCLFTKDFNLLYMNFCKILEKMVKKIWVCNFRHFVYPFLYACVSLIQKNAFHRAIIIIII